MHNSLFFLFVLIILSSSHPALSVRVKQNNGELDIRASKDLNQKSIKKTTGFSPKKGKPEWIALDSPIKRRMKIVAKVNRQKAHVIDTNHTDFSTGNWSFVDPFAPESSLAISADEISWKALIQKFNASSSPNPELKEAFNEKYFESFLVDLAHFLHENILNIDKLAVRSPSNEDPVCRHFATYTAILFSKLLNQFSPNWQTYIQVVGANVVESDLSLVEDGHVWNLVTVEVEGKKSYWLFDALHHTMVRLKSNLRLASTKKIKYKNKKNIIHENIKKNSLFYNTTKLSLERFLIKNEEKNLYSEDYEKAWDQLSQKVASRAKDRLTQQSLVISRKTARPEDCEDITNQRRVKRKLAL